MSAVPEIVHKLRQVVPNMTPEQKLRAYQLLKRRLELMPLKTSVSFAELSKLESDFSYFCREAWKALYPTADLIWSWHYDLIAEHLELVRRRQLRRVIFNVPPRSLKTWQISVFFPCWAWLSQPEHSFLCASYSRDLSTDHSIFRRNLIQSVWYQSLFADRFQLSSDRNLTTQFSNNKGGQMIATSTGSGAEGRGGDTAILDDPMSNEQALSDTERASANNWISGTLMQRLNNPRTGAIILIMQRLHEMDTTGYVKEHWPGEWTHVVVPLVAEDDVKSRTYSFPVSGREFVRPQKDVLQPERFSPEIVKEKEGNRLVFAGQYQQRPAPLEGNLIKRSEVRYHSGRDPVTQLMDPVVPKLRSAEWFTRVIVSVDASFKDLETSDFCCVGVVGVRKRRRCVLDVVNEHLDINALEQVILRKREQWAANTVLIEQKANGPAVTQRIKNSIPGVIEIEPQGGKIARMFAASPEWQAGDWEVDRTAAWCEPFVQQITMFPAAKNDDMVDMMTQVAVWLQANSSADIWARM
jgi:predicted phage terminase large subunit-like protein